jgi:hypothetical protein
MKRVIAYTLLAVWTGVATVLQAFAVEGLGLGAWTPDLPLFLLVAALAQLHRSDAVRVAIVAGLARATFTVEPPFGVLAGMLAVGLVADGVRRIAELSRPSTRALLVGTSAFLFGLWLVLVDAVRAGDVAVVMLRGAVSLVPTALTSALFALAAWPLARALPGLRSIERRAF